ncbi:MAG: hypothetical protein M3R38_03735 [Actinomycetota bacterium]|nr:hypothetical protein [Actinomycetota bacterium]
MTDETTPQDVPAIARHQKAQADEAEARTRGGDPVAIMEAKAEAVKAMDEIYRLQNAARTGEGEEKVSLVSPNPYANVVDANGLRFVDGRAEGVPRSLARRYVDDFDGYRIEEGTA